MEFIILIAVCYLIFLFVKIYKFNKSTYHKSTHYSFFATIYNAGRNGEYRIFKYLQSFENKGCKFLFNVYLPKDDGGTTEIDVLMLAPKGIVVF